VGLYERGGRSCPQLTGREQRAVLSDPVVSDYQKFVAGLCIPERTSVAVNADARITIDDANRIAQERTGGEVSVVSESECIQLCRKGYFIVKELDQVLDMTAAGIRRALIGWEGWPPNRR